MIFSLTTDVAGQIGVYPRTVRITTSDSLATVTAAGYLSPEKIGPFSIYASDLVLICYDATSSRGPGTLGQFTVSISGGVITLVPQTNSGAVTVTGTPIANHIAYFTGAGDAISLDGETIINAGNIQAGLSGTAGYVDCFPGTALKGNLRLLAAANVGNTRTTITNASMGQASVITIPDPAAATANFAITGGALVSGNFVKAVGTSGIIVDAGFNQHNKKTDVWGGGGTTHSFTATDISVGSIVVATLLTATNIVPFTAAAGAGSLDVTFDSDPGAGTSLTYFVASAAA